MTNTINADKTRNKITDNRYSQLCNSAAELVIDAGFLHDATQWNVVIL